METGEGECRREKKKGESRREKENVEGIRRREKADGRRRKETGEGEGERSREKADGRRSKKKEKGEGRCVYTTYTQRPLRNLYRHSCTHGRTHTGMNEETLKTPIPKCRLYRSFLFGVV
jgi:hypothetical protein